MKLDTKVKYRTILADPPWMESGGGRIKRGADAHYPLMKTKDICALPVEDLVSSNAHLYLWTTNNHLPDALRVIEAWGFRYISAITWCKQGKPGLGQYFRGLTEHCLFAVRGNLPYKLDVAGKRQQGTTVIHAPRGRHSEKPEAMRSIIQTVSYGPFLELFARRDAPGWDVWGNEVGSDIDLGDVEAGRPVIRLAA